MQETLKPSNVIDNLHMSFDMTNLNDEAIDDKQEVL